MNTHSWVSYGQFDRDMLQGTSNVTAGNQTTSPWQYAIAMLVPKRSVFRTRYLKDKTILKNSQPIPMERQTAVKNSHPPIK